MFSKVSVSLYLVAFGCLARSFKAETEFNTNAEIAIEKQQFLSDFMDSRCPKASSDDASYEKCVETARNVHESINMMKYYENTVVLNEKIGIALNDANWQSHLEGNSFGHYEKEKLIQSLANDVRVKTICEIGFNSGYSALNYLTVNPNATVISFDIFRWDYSAVANIALNEMFPGRHLITIAGDSQYSVPMFHEIMKRQQTKSTQHYQHTTKQIDTNGEVIDHSDVAIADNVPLCNMIFIDGGHSREQFLSDLKMLKRLADPAYHTILIDDFSVPDINSAYYEQEALGLVKNTRLLENIRFYDYITWEMLTDGSAAFSLREWSRPYVPGSVAMSQYVF